MPKATCPNCAKSFNCDGNADCWCLKVDSDFDYQELIIRTGKVACVCPVCLTGKAGADEARADGVGTSAVVS